MPFKLIINAGCDIPSETPENLRKLIEVPRVG